MDPLTILQGVASGLLTGGASAGTTFLTVFRDIKKRLTDLEKRLGDPEAEPITGLFGTVDQLSKSLRAIRNEIESWRDEPPDWLVRIAQRASRASSTNEVVREFEERIFQRIKRLEEDLDRREDKLQNEIQKSSPEFTGTFVTREEYEEDSRRRASELRKIQENLKSANSFLRGMLTAQGYLDPEPPSTGSDPVIPPVRVPRPAPTPGKPFPPPLKKK